LCITGSADTPVYIYIDDDMVEIRDAGNLWGKDTYALDTALTEMCGKKFHIVSIGPAGENKVPLAAIMHDGKAGRAAGRSGLGAVMGSKKLKAVAVKGSQAVQVVRPNELKKQLKPYGKRLAGNLCGLSAHGTSGDLMASERTGNLPLQNFKKSSWPDAEKLTGEIVSEKYLTKRYACGACTIGCGRDVKISGGKYGDVEGAGPEYETIGSLGTFCLIDDLEAVCKGNELCNRYGMDTISVGAVIAFAMEAYENKVISDCDCDGTPLTWGNAEAMLAMIRQIGENRGLGTTLGLGVKKASQILGGGSQAYAIHVKGMEFPAHDPRAYFSTAVALATSNRGACHLAAFAYGVEGSLKVPELNYSHTLNPHTNEGKGELVAKMQNLSGILDSLKICKFVLYGGLSVTELLAVFNHITGYDLDMDTFLRTGERIFNLKRMYNVRLGIRRKDDNLPERITSLKKDSGEAKGQLPDLERQLNDYYAYRGWTEDGIPKKETLSNLNIEYAG
jgi:aldehyde:ferredoxin oxidoreductase